MRYEHYYIRLSTNQYADNKNLAIEMICRDLNDPLNYEEPFSVMTVNLEGFILKDNQAFVDVNNLPGIESFIKKYELGKFTGMYTKSGFCDYPLYEFYPQTIAKYSDYKEE